MGERHASRKDTTQKVIIQALEDAGAAVWDIGQPLDLLVAYKGRFYILESKSKYGKLSSKQNRDVARMLVRGCVPGIVKTPEEALKSIGALAS